MIALVEGADRQKTPNEIALNILLAEFGDFGHDEFGDLFVGADGVAAFVEVREVERGAEMHADGLAAAHAIAAVIPPDPTAETRSR